MDLFPAFMSAIPVPKAREKTPRFRPHVEKEIYLRKAKTAARLPRLQNISSTAIEAFILHSTACHTLSA